MFPPVVMGFPRLWMQLCLLLSGVPGELLMGVRRVCEEGVRLGPGVTGSLQTEVPPPPLGVCPSRPAVRQQLFSDEGFLNGLIIA